MKISAGLIIGTLVGATFLGGIAVAGISYVTAANKGNRMEVALKARHTNLGNVLSSGYQQISGVAQVPGMARDDLKDVFTAAITAREGEEGSRAVFKMITEHNPTIDPSLYTKVQQVVESTKKEYQAEQTSFLNQKAAYETELGTVWGGMWMRIAGYPKVDLDSLKIVTTGAASRALATGIEEEIKLR